MWRHFLKLAIRNISRKGLFSLLNIGGLCIGLASFMVIMLYVFQESNYEKGFSKEARTYRLYTQMFDGSAMATSSSNLQIVMEELSEVESSTSMTRVPPLKTLTIREKSHSVENYFFTDNNFLKVFDYQFSVGNKELALNSPYSAILTEDEAFRLFGKKDVLNESITLDKEQYVVTGVLKPTIFKSHLEFEALLIKGTPVKYDIKRWVGGGPTYTYVTLGRNVTADQLNSRLDEMVEKYYFPGLKAVLPIREGFTFEDWITRGNIVRSYAQPIGDIYLKSNLTIEIKSGGNRKTVMTFALIAVIILVISCANFINLSTARASDRAKELGVRKVIGSTRKVIVTQLLIESMGVVVCAGILALGLTELSLKIVNGLFDGFISISLISTPVVILPLIAIILIVGLVSGLYPAFYLSSFKATSLLKGQRVRGFKGAGAAQIFRNLLVIVQFSLSAILIIGAIFISGQLRLLRNIDLGFEEQDVLVVEDLYKLGNQASSFVQEVRKKGFVREAGILNRLPGEGGSPFKRNMSSSDGQQFSVDEISGDTEMFNALGVELIAGRTFSDSLTTDKNKLVLNETAAALLVGAMPVGQMLRGQEIIGVVKDFHFESLRNRIGPVIFKFNSRYGKLAIKMPLNPENIQSIEETWNQFSQAPLNRSFLQDNYDRILATESRIGNVFGLFTGLAIFISCLGIYGLTLFAADQRAKEFGIRKVLGANVSNIIRLLIANFFGLVGIALLVAVPVSIWGINKWLEDFAYRIDLDVFTFIFGALIITLIVILTVFHQSYKSAVRNPVETLKSE